MRDPQRDRRSGVGPRSRQASGGALLAPEVAQGKPACKAALQRELRLEEQPDAPLIGAISRLDEQKGFDLVAKVIEEWGESTDAQWVILGKGEPEYHGLFEDLARRFPKKGGRAHGVLRSLAHRIEAGSDIFLMPSRYEPCGLNQMYSLRYGTVPVVRQTGGLADTIVDATEASLAARTANGFSFVEDSPAALSETLRRAVDAYRRREAWSRLIATGMRQDWSWAKSAKRYENLYEKTVARARQSNG